jgi:hypothetical protein
VPYVPEFGFPWTTDMQGASSHSWSAAASNLGATPPDPASADTVIKAMGQHLDTGGKLKCSTCHDTHNSGLAQGNVGTVHASKGWATNIPTTAGVSAGTLQLTSTPPGAKAGGYMIKITAADPACAFKISHDGGLTYLGYAGTTWASANPNGKPCTTKGSPITLDDNLTTVTFSSAGTFSDQVWKFSVSYPFLRGNAARMCISCHKDRNQTYTNVEGTGTVPGTLQPVLLTTTVFSHPVNQPLNANGGGYDRTLILDANGATSQTTGDGNTANDLVLDTAGNVNCLTCHHPHNAPSNSANSHNW